MKTTFLLLGGTFIQLAAAIPAAEAHLPLRGFPPTVHGIGNSFQDGCIVPTKHHPSTVYSPPFTSALVSPTTLRTVPSAIPTSVSHGTHSSSTSKPAPKPSGGGGKAITGKNPYTTNGIKAGLSGYPKINLYSTEGMNAFAPYIGWYSDYTPSTPDYGKVQGIPMLWGDGVHCGSSTDVISRVRDFWDTIAHTTPKIMFGFYEPDCNCPMSADMSDPVYGARKWNEMLAPLAKKGTTLGSPSMCKQADEDWLTPFKKAGLDADWEVTSIHINAHNLDGVKRDVEHYAKKYGKPIWVSEFACVHAGPDFFNPCTDQGEIDNFINAIVPWLEANETIVAYGASNGEGLGNVWPLLKNGALSHSGHTYVNALKNLRK